MQWNETSSTTSECCKVKTQGGREVQVLDMEGEVETREENIIDLACHKVAMDVTIEILQPFYQGVSKI